MIVPDQQSSKNSCYVLSLPMSTVDLVIKLYNLDKLTVMRDRVF